MRKTFQSLLFVSLFGALCAFGANPPREGVLFFHSFDHGLNADYAAGNPVPTNAAGAQTAADGHIGAGLVQNSPGGIRFAAEGNIQPEAGTVAMWVKPVNWNGDDKMFHFFFNAGTMAGKNARNIQLYKFCTGPLMLLARNPGQTAQCQVANSNDFRKWKAGEWHHLAFSWSKADRKCILYIDGKEYQGEIPDGVFPDNAAQLAPGLVFNTVGAGEFCDPEQRTIMDDIYIFDRPIGERGVAELRAAGQSVHAPEFVVPRTRRAPVIDGKIDDGEYADFFSTNTFVELGKMGFHSRETRIYTAYDDQNLYVTFQSRTKGADLNVEIAARHTERDSEVWLDDAVELLLLPPNEGLVQIVGNSIGAIYDSKKGRADFQGKYEVANLIRDIWWVSEMKLPFAELGFKPPRPGDRWQMNLTRDWQNPMVFTSLSDTANFHDPVTMPVWTFGDDRGTGTLHLDIESAQTQLLTLDGSATDMPATATIYTRDHAGTPVVLREMKLQAAPGKPQSAKLEASLVSFDTRKYQNKIGFSLVRADGAVLQKSEYVLRSFSPLELNLSLLSDQKKLYYTIDFAGLALPLKKIALECTFMENGRSVRSWRVEQPAERMFAGELTPELWQSGNVCELRVRALDCETGKMVIEKLFSLSLPQAETWRNSTAGQEAVVPPPWTPVTRTGRSVRMWNREYRLQDNALPENMISGGVPLLAAPVELKLIGGDGRQVRFGSLSFTDGNRPDEVRFQAEATHPDFLAKLDGVIEFDGFSWYTLKLTPRRKGVQLNQFSLTFGMPESEVNFAQINHSTYATLKKAAEIPAAMSLPRQILFGNDHRALAFFTESEEFFRPENRPDSVLSSVRDGVRYVTVDAVKGPVALDREFNFGFGWQAAPVKPLPKQWRDWVQSYSGKFKTSPDLIQIWSWSRWYGFMRPISEANFRKYMGMLREKYPNAVIQPYFCQYLLSMVAPEFKLYGDEWTRHPRVELMEAGPQYPGKSVVACLGPASYRDFWLDSLRRFLDDYPDVNGCYWDSIDPGYCHNPMHGHGWTDSNGKRHDINDILHYREFYKRAYKIFKAKHPDAIITGHASARRYLPTLAFCDVVYDGEQFVAAVSSNPDYCQWLDDNYCRAFFGTQFGVVPMFLPAYYNNEKQIAKETMPTETIFLHSLVYGFLVHSHRVNNQVSDAVWEITRAFGLRDAEFFAPWDQRGKAFVTVESPGDDTVRAGIYRHADGRLLVALGNFGAQPATAKLKFAASGAVTEKRAGQKLAAGSDGAVSVTIPPHNFLLLEQ